MPPRYAYWTILAGGLPTAFRAAEREELLPTFKRIQEKHSDAQMKWFAKGKLWDSPEAARADSPVRPFRRDDGRGDRGERGSRPPDRDRDRRPPSGDRSGAPSDGRRGGPSDDYRRGRPSDGDRGGGPSDGDRRGGPSGPPASEKRGKGWRPGGEHRDPRQPFKDAKKAKNQDRRQQRWENTHRPKGQGQRDQGWARPQEQGQKDQGWAKPQGQGRRDQEWSGRPGPSVGGARPSGRADKRFDRPGSAPLGKRPWEPRPASRTKPHGDKFDRFTRSDSRGPKPWAGGDRQARDQRNQKPWSDRPPRKEWNDRGPAARDTRPPRKEWNDRGPAARDTRPPRKEWNDRGPAARDTRPPRKEWNDRGPAARDTRPPRKEWNDRGGSRRFMPKSGPRAQGTEEPAQPARPMGPNREPRPSQEPKPGPPPRPNEPEIPPPGPQERGKPKRG